MNSEVRVVKYFSDTVADYAYRLEKKCRFLWLEYWACTEVTYLQSNGESWANHYDCEIVDKK